VCVRAAVVLFVATSRARITAAARHLRAALAKNAAWLPKGYVQGTTFDAVLDESKDVPALQSAASASSTAATAVVEAPSIVQPTPDAANAAEEEPEAADAMSDAALFELDIHDNDVAVAPWVAAMQVEMDMQIVPRSNSSSSTRWNRDDKVPLLLGGMLPDDFTDDDAEAEQTLVEETTLVNEAPAAPALDVSYEFDDDLFIVRKLTANGKRVLSEGKIYAKLGRGEAEPATAIFSDNSEYDVPQVTVGDLAYREAACGGKKRTCMDALAPKPDKKRKRASTASEFEIKQKKTGNVIAVVIRPQKGRSDLMLVEERTQDATRPRQRVQVDITKYGVDLARKVCIKLAQKLAEGPTINRELTSIRDILLANDEDADAGEEENEEEVRADEGEGEEEGKEEDEVGSGTD
jgi:hypothetical protein